MLYHRWIKQVWTNNRGDHFWVRWKPRVSYPGYWLWRRVYGGRLGWFYAWPGDQDFLLDDAGFYKLGKQPGEERPWRVDREGVVHKPDRQVVLRGTKTNRKIRI